MFWALIYWISLLVHVQIKKPVCVLSEAQLQGDSSSNGSIKNGGRPSCVQAKSNTGRLTSSSFLLPLIQLVCWTCTADIRGGSWCCNSTVEIHWWCFLVECFALPKYCSCAVSPLGSPYGQCDATRGFPVNIYTEWKLLSSLVRRLKELLGKFGSTQCL